MISFKKRAKAPKLTQLGDGLPSAPTVGLVDPLSLRYLMIAPPGWGKTELFMSFPDSILLACEEGHKLVEGYKLVIDCYDYTKHSAHQEPWKDQDGNIHSSFKQAVKNLQETDRFKFVIIDTVDALVKMIVDYHVQERKVEGRTIEHIEELGGYGRGYDIGQNSPFRRATNSILKTGRGIGYITHQYINERTFATGQRSKKETTLPSGISKLIVPQVDIAMHGEFGKRRKPNRFKDRIIVTEGSEETLAKNRGGIMPNRFILPYDFEERWKTIKSFFPKNLKNIEKAEQVYLKIYGE